MKKTSTVHLHIKKYYFIKKKHQFIVSKHYTYFFHLAHKFYLIQKEKCLYHNRYYE